MNGEIPGHDLYETLTTIREGRGGCWLSMQAAGELIELLEQTANAILRRWAAELRFFETELAGNPVDVLRRYNNYEWANDQVRDVVNAAIAGAAADHADHGYDDLRRHVEAHQQFEQATLEEEFLPMRLADELEADADVLLKAVCILQKIGGSPGISSDAWPVEEIQGVAYGLLEARRQITTRGENDG